MKIKFTAECEISDEGVAKCHIDDIKQYLQDTLKAACIVLKKKHPDAIIPENISIDADHRKQRGRTDPRRN